MDERNGQCYSIGGLLSATGSLDQLAAESSIPEAFGHGFHNHGKRAFNRDAENRLLGSHCVLDVVSGHIVPYVNG